MAKRKDGEQKGQAQKLNRQNKHLNADGKTGLGTPSAESSEHGNIQNSTSDSTSQRAKLDRLDFDRRTVAGGILRQLIKQSSNQLAYHEAQVQYHNSQAEELRNTCRQLQILFDELESKIRESWESAVEEPSAGEGEEE
jgi:hypothetical protein